MIINSLYLLVHLSIVSIVHWAVDKEWDIGFLLFYTLISYLIKPFVLGEVYTIPYTTVILIPNKDSILRGCIFLLYFSLYLVSLIVLLQ